jgi:hypothetical protein
MDAGEFRRVKALFDRLAELPPTQRAAALHGEAQIGAETRRHLRVSTRGFTANDSEGLVDARIA